MEGNEKKRSSGFKSSKPLESSKPPGWLKRSKSPIFYGSPENPPMPPKRSESTKLSGSPKTTPKESNTTPKARNPPSPKSPPLINKNGQKSGRSTNVELPNKDPSLDVYDGSGREQNPGEAGRFERRAVESDDSSGEGRKGKWSGSTQTCAHGSAEFDRSKLDGRVILKKNPSGMKEGKSDGRVILEKSPSGMREGEELYSGAVCRICMKGVPRSLITPCDCKGVYAHSHAACLSEWLEATGSDHCDICRFKYKVVKRPMYLCDWVQDNNKAPEYSEAGINLLLSLFILFLAFVVCWSIYGTFSP